MPDAQWLMQFPDSFTVAGAVPGLFAIERTGFPFHPPMGNIGENLKYAGLW